MRYRRRERMVDWRESVDVDVVADEAMKSESKIRRDYHYINGGEDVNVDDTVPANDGEDVAGMQ